MKKLIIAACVACFGFASVDSIMSRDEAEAWKAEHEEVAEDYECLCTGLNTENFSEHDEGEFDYRYYSLVGYKEDTNETRGKLKYVEIDYEETEEGIKSNLGVQYERFAGNSENENNGTTFELKKDDAELKNKLDIDWNMPGDFEIAINSDTPEQIKDKMLHNLGCDSVTLSILTRIKLSNANDESTPAKVHQKSEIRLYNKNGRLVDRTIGWKW